MSRGAQSLDAMSFVRLNCVRWLPNICGPSVWDLLHVALLASRILSLVPDSWKICGPLRMITWTDGRVDVLLVFPLIQEVPVFPTLAHKVVMF